MKVVLGAFLLASIVLTGCVTTQRDENSVRPGMRLTGSISIGVGSMQIPLPDGEWEVASTHSTQNNHNVTVFSAILFQEENSELKRAIYFSTPLSVDNNGLGYTPHKSCSRDDMHYRETLADTSGGKQDCEWVNHYILTLEGSKYKISHNAGVYLKNKGVSYPNHLIQVGNRIADELTFLTYYHYFNPTTDGFDNLPRTAWFGSPWHPTAVSGDEKKSEYIKRLIKWGKDWHSKVKAGFSRKLASKKEDQATPITGSPTVPERSGSASERLTELKGLYEKKLITEGEYEIRRKAILDGL